MKRQIWVNKSKQERVRSLYEVLKNYEEIFLVDLIKKHPKEIGVNQTPDEPLVHQVWEIVKYDCNYLEREGKIKIKKDSKGRIIIYSLKEEAKDKLFEGEELIKGDKDIEKTADHELEERRKVIELMFRKVQSMKAEILEIWKHIEQIRKEQSKVVIEKDDIISTLQGLIEKLR